MISRYFYNIVKHTFFSDLCSLINQGKITDHEKMAS
jgi:hypothetical protein